MCACHGVRTRLRASLGRRRHWSAGGGERGAGRALALEPRHPAALLQKARLIEEGGDSRNVARLYRNVLLNLPPATAR